VSADTLPGAPLVGRDALLAEYLDLDEPPGEADLQVLAELASLVCGTPFAAVNLISQHLQHQVAAVGVPPEICSREDSMCAVSLDALEPLMVPDAREDPRFAANPFVTGRLGDVRAYAASQLRTPRGDVLGTLCVFDVVPRDLGPRQRRGLDLLAAQTVTALELRRSQRVLASTVRELAEARAELLRSNSDLAAFAGQVSHDLRNPLAAVGGYLELLADQPAVAADATASRQVERASASTDRMRDLVDELLAYARVGGGLRQEPVDLGALVRDVVDDLAAGGGPAAADLEVSSLPVVRGDPTQLRAVLQNLITNAVHYASPDRRLVLRLGARPAGQRWRVEVSDNGRGIPVDQRGEAFALLRRLHCQGTAGDGSGIGLATCRRIVAAHGGTIGIDDGIDGGVTVWFTLPAL
jgi:signal transduction histidine kinase